MFDVDCGGGPRRSSVTLGTVVIGRNEGERLRRCLASVTRTSARNVYVDSGSDDDSIAIAREFGVQVIELDRQLPFTAARARNAGFCQLLAMNPLIEYVFFIDGDCEVLPGWLDTAERFLNQNSQIAAVSGLRRERHPDKSIYNLLIDLEWRDYASGESKFCGGDVVMRVLPFKRVSGYRPELICGEEPELCVRLRQLGWRIWRLNEPMTVHDAAMYQFRQWWKREVRTGYAFAHGAALHGESSERHSVDDSRRAWMWGLALPLLIVMLICAVGWRGLLLGLVYPVQIVRLALTSGHPSREAWSRAVALVIGKFPQVIGELKFFGDRMRAVPTRLIEYK